MKIFKGFAPVNEDGVWETWINRFKKYVKAELDKNLEGWEEEGRVKIVEIEIKVKRRRGRA